MQNKELLLKAGYVYMISYTDKSRVTGVTVRSSFPAVTVLKSYLKLPDLKVEMIKAMK